MVHDASAVALARRIQGAQTRRPLNPRGPAYIRRCDRFHSWYIPSHIRRRIGIWANRRRGHSPLVTARSDTPKCSKSHERLVGRRGRIGR